MELPTQLGLLAGAAVAVLAEIAALRSLDRLGRLMAFSALAQAGAALVGMSLGQAAGPVGAASLVLYQTLARVLWWLCLRRMAGGGTLPGLNALRGAGAASPALAACLGLAVFTALGLGPFKAPGGKALIVFAALEGGHWITALALAAAGFAAAVYSIRIVLGVCLEKPGRAAPASATSGLPVVPVVLGALLTLACLFPHPVAGLAQALAGKSGAVLPDLEGGWPLAAAVPFAGAYLVWLAGRAAPRARNLLALALAAATAGCFLLQGGLDPLQTLFGGLFALGGAAVVLYSVGYEAHDEHADRYWFFLFLLVSSLVGLAVERSTGGFFAFWEIMTFSSTLLVAHKQSREALDAAKLYFIMCAGGALALQVGLLALAAAAPGASLLATGQALAAYGPAASAGLALLMLAGFGVKAGLFPLHAWLPAAHPVAPSSISAPLSGLLTKAGVLGLAVLAPLFASGALNGGGQTLGWLLSLAAGITFVLGELMALAQRDIKRMLAYSTLAQIGEITLILALGTHAATAGALAHAVNHAVMKDLLFLAAGALILRAGTQRLEGLAGLGKAMPFTGACMAVGLVSIMGLPLTGGFFSKYLMLTAAVDAGHAWTAALILAGSLVGCVYYGRILRVLFFTPYEGTPVEEAPWTMRAAVGLLAVAALVSGAFPQAWTSMVLPAANALVPAAQALPLLSVPWSASALLPLAGAVAAIVWRRDLRRAGIWATACLGLAFVALLAEWSAWGGFQMAFAGLVLALGVCNMAYSTGYMSHSHTPWRFLASFCVMIAGLVGMAGAETLLAFFCFWEIMSSWPLYFAILHEETPAARREATKYFLFNLAGASILFMGLLLLTGAAGGGSFAQVSALFAAQAPSAWGFSAALVIAGLLMKAAMLPVRIDWQMHPATAPTPVSGYISAMLLKSAPFGIVLLRFVWAQGISPESAQVLDALLYVGAWIGGATILYAGIQALVQTGIKEMLIYSTVSQLGYVVLGVCLATPLGLMGGLLHLFNHMLFKNLAFLCAGALMFSTHAHSLHELGGIGRRMPWTLAAFGCALLAAAGMPLFNGFASKYVLYYALIDQGEWALAVVAILTSVVTLAYFLKFLHTAFFGQPSAKALHASEPGLLMRAPILILAGLCLLTGLFPGLALKPIASFVRDFGLAAPSVGLSGILEGPGAMDNTLLGFMILLTGLGVWTAVSRLARNARRTAIHTCGQLVDPASTHVGPADVFATPLSLLTRLSRGHFRVPRHGGSHD
ncbi:Hydrogenase-4 component B [Fundidesulfovibrio magnetotacticus]|uniref:Hydrogenase-4 component B n=1 Tax=Fundidesulfovibrio magnetotacticus TaxID=2730080 RepID=A0A6V8M2L8_9BACT|nr:proton-conducting transporter membrane subunit [Fundidesulfovibrio magnetotacticus]GFK94685.1 Hydrogenase-4 component B [Fundidesulfovibrio magnetotacticus]